MYCVWTAHAAFAVSRYYYYFFFVTGNLLFTFIPWQVEGEEDIHGSLVSCFQEARSCCKEVKKYQRGEDISSSTTIHLLLLLLLLLGREPATLMMIKGILEIFQSWILRRRRTTTDTTVL